MNQSIMTSGSSCSSLGGVKGMVVQTLILLLMVQKSGDHQWRLVVYLIIYKVLCIPGCSGFLPSTVGILLIGSISWIYKLVSKGV